MNDEEKAAAITTMAAARVKALRTAAARDIALRLLEADGSVSKEDVETLLAAEFTPPTPTVLLGQLVAKAAAAVEHQLTVVEGERSRLEGLSAKVEKYRALLDQATHDLETFETSSEADYRDAVELAEFLRTAHEGVLDGVD